jgi:hypothetical protein
MISFQQRCVAEKCFKNIEALLNQNALKWLKRWNLRFASTANNDIKHENSGE